MMGKESRIFTKKFHLSAIRWPLLALSWILFVTALFMPGVYTQTGIVSSQYATLPTWIVILWIVFLIPGVFLERGGASDFFHNYLRHGWIVPATALVILSVIVGCVFFLISPLFLFLAPRFRFISNFRWISFCFLGGWLLPFWGWLFYQETTFLIGYYLIAAALTLAFFAVILTPIPHAQNGRRGFEPLVKH